MVHKRPFPNDSTSSDYDEPPSYDALMIDKDSSDAKASIQTPPPFKTSTFVQGNSKKVSNGWFGAALASARMSREIRNTVQSLLRDLVQNNASTSSTAGGILDSCAAGCAVNGVSFLDILQERYIEGHTPLFWAIVKRVPDDYLETGDQGPNLVTALISYSSPFKEETITDIRQACLATSDQNLFKRLGQSPGFARMSPLDQVILGSSLPLDEIEVEVNKDSFAVDFVIPQFLKRMAVSKRIPLEFIARGRLWCLKFFRAEHEGTWWISLSLLDSSPPTHLDSRLLILEAATPIVQVHTPPSSTSSSFFPKNSTNQNKSMTDFSFRLQTTSELKAGYQIQKPFENISDKLQYHNNPYIGSEEKLRARLEARLGKYSDNECIIC